MKSTIQKLADAIQQEEGYYEGSRSYRNKNPGNLRFSMLTTALGFAFTAKLGAMRNDKDNFAVFPTYEKGYEALCEFLKLACEDKLKDYHQARSLRQFIQVYALPPASHPYAENVAKKLGVSPDVNIATFLESETVPPQPPPEFVPPPVPIPPPPYIQKILAIQMGAVYTDKATALLKEWFEKQGIPTEIETVNDGSSFNYVSILGISVPVPDPEEAKVIASRYIKDHHFVLLCYEGNGTFLEFNQLFLGANIVYIPIIPMNTAEYVCEYMVHEILHGWYARLAWNNISATGTVHSYSFTDTRPEANYSSLVAQLKPYADVIFRPITIPEKISFLQAAINGFVALLKSLFR